MFKFKLFYFLLILVTANCLSQEFSIYDDDGFFERTIEEIEENPVQGIKSIDSIAQHIPENEKIQFSLMENYYKGMAYRNLSNFELLSKHFEEARRIAVEHNYETYIPEIHRELGDEYMDQDMHQKAIENYDIAIEWYKKLGNEIGVITCTYEGFIESEQEKYDESNRKLIKLLPVLKKAHPVYLDALSTIAGNYLELHKIDSAFIFANKMPLETISDSNNFNYTLHKYYIAFHYFLEKEKIDSANYFNNLIGKHRFSKEIEIYYFKNKIEIAKTTNNTKNLIAYTDSLDSAYEERLIEVAKEDVYTSEKVIKTENSLQQEKQNKQKQFYFFLILTIALLILGLAIFFYFKKLRRLDEQKIENMKIQLENVSKQMFSVDKENTNQGEISLEHKILEITKKFELSDREADILHHILQGYKNAEIADKLFISTNTVKYHIKNLYVKLDVSKRAEISSKLIFDK